MIVRNLLLAALTGAEVPLPRRQLGIASAVFVTIFTDGFGFRIFPTAGDWLVVTLG